MASLDEVVSNMKNGVLNLSNMVKAIQDSTVAIKSVFPQQSGTATTATGGAAALPANPTGFIVVTLPDGTLAKVPYYSD